MKVAVGICMVLMLVAGMAGCERSRPLQVAAHVWPGYELMFLGDELGWLDHGQVELVRTRYASESVEALVTGQVDAAALTLDEVLSAREQGVPLTVVLVFNVSAGADVVIARPGLERYDDLRGMRVGYEHGAVGALMLEKALAHAGLELDDIVRVNLPPSRHLTAWDVGLVDALVTYEPLASQLRKQGGTVMFDSRQAPNRIVDVLAVRSDRLGWRESRGLRHLLQVHFQALEHFQRNPQDAAYRMASRLSLHVADVSLVFRGLVLPDAENNHRLLSGDPPPLVRSAAELSRLMHSSELLPRVDEQLLQLVDDGYLPALQPR